MPPLQLSKLASRVTSYCNASKINLSWLASPEVNVTLVLLIVFLLAVIVCGAENPSKTLPFSARDGSLESTQNKRVAIIVNHRSDLRRATTSYGGKRQSPKKSRDKKTSPAYDARAHLHYSRLPSLVYG